MTGDHRTGRAYTPGTFAHAASEVRARYQEALMVEDEILNAAKRAHAKAKKLLLTSAKAEISKLKTEYSCEFGWDDLGYDL